MSKPLVLIVVLLLSMGCKNSVAPEDLPLLNGYWEIEHVTFPDGNTKQYTVNTTIDFIKIEDLKGYRKKLRPKFDGTYDATDDAVLFSIYENAGQYSFHYKSNTEEWTERIMQLEKDNFAVATPDNVIYSYKRFQPINVDK